MSDHRQVLLLEIDKQFKSAQKSAKKLSNY
jgi:hypothetical protein